MFLFIYFFSLSFLLKTCSVVNLPHKIHRNNFSLKKQKQKKKTLSLYTIISSGILSWQYYALLRFPIVDPITSFDIPFDPPISFIYMGMSIDLTKKVYIFFNKDAKYAKNINTDAKKKKKLKNKEERRQRKLS